VPVQTRTVVTLNGRRVTWRQLRPGDRVHVVYEGYARLVEARR
jgi:3-dehydroquinate synthase class II